MRLLRNHLLIEFFIPFFSTLGIILISFLLGRGIVQMADLVLNKDVDIVLILKMLFFSLPFILTFAIPMAVLVSTLLSFGRLSYDNEIMAMRASGISMLRTVAPLLISIIVLCAATYVMSDRVASATHYIYRKLVTQIGIENPTAALEEGTFIKKFKNFIIFIYEIDKTKLKGVRIYQPQEGKPTRTIIAQKGEIISIPEEGIIKLRLMHGTSDEPDPKDPSKLYKLNFRTYDLPLSISEFRTQNVPEKKPKDMTVTELRSEIRRLGDAGIAATYPLSAEIHNKIALSFSSLAFFLIAVPLAITTRRSEKSFGFGISLALMAIYWTLLIGGKAMAAKGVAHPFVALECANFIIGSIGIVLFGKLIKR